MDGDIEAGVYLALLVVCVALAMLTVVSHAIALAIIRRRLSWRIRGKSYSDHVFREAVIISATVLSLSVAHLFEICIWAAAYVALGAIADPHDALYYSISTYTTLGADGVSIAKSFRAIAAFESLIGPMMVAWSTAFLVEFVTRMRGPNST
ncbi:ion channel [Xanthobacter autotrophicus]|uniref:ion channel n=1 Tax=Xanthobacter autotrophicus TaxID=280 RepID=UPI0024A76D34|nr:ion channel [Xanthobacter autotrophicus]MDI4657087.1 potassium channel family protein [Xanthobacter autotrophicus]